MGIQCGLWSQAAWVQILALPLKRNVTLSELFKLSMAETIVPQTKTFSTYSPLPFSLDRAFTTLQKPRIPTILLATLELGIGL